MVISLHITLTKFFIKNFKIHDKMAAYYKMAVVKASDKKVKFKKSSTN
jgi:hypothetical protein